VPALADGAAPQLAAARLAATPAGGGASAIGATLDAPGVQALATISGSFPAAPPSPPPPPAEDRRLREPSEARPLPPMELPPIAPQSAPPPGGPAAAAFDLEPMLLPALNVAVSPSPGPAVRPVQLPESESALPLPPIGAPAPAAARPAIAPPLPLFPAEVSSSSAPPSPEPTPPPPEPASTVTAPSGDEEYYRQVYKEFLSVKRQCGENVANLTFERFADKLNRNRETLVARYSCKAVRFQVYIKDGKAALKATPVKD
jgi:hypothetical protein